MLRIIQVGQGGFYRTRGLQETINVKQNEKGDLSKKYISGTFYDGSQIEDEKEYTGLTLDFLLAGGDDFKDVIGKVYTPRGVKYEGDLVKDLKEGLKKMEVIKEGTLIDPKHPRLILAHVKDD